MVRDTDEYAPDFLEELARRAGMTVDEANDVVTAFLDIMAERVPVDQFIALGGPGCESSEDAAPGQVGPSGQHRPSGPGASASSGAAYRKPMFRSRRAQAMSRGRNYM